MLTLICFKRLFMLCTGEQKPCLSGWIKFFFLQTQACQRSGGPTYTMTFLWPKAVDWESIATCLNLAFSTEDKPVYLKGRGCRERMNRLVEKYKWKKLKLWNDML